MKNKILFGTILILITFCSINTTYGLENDRYINYNNIEMTAEQFNNLKNLGFDDNQIAEMDLEEFNKNKDLIGQVVSQTTKYYKTVKFSNNNTLNYLSRLNNDSMVITTEITEEEYESNNDYVIQPFENKPGITDITKQKLVTTIVAVNGRYRLKTDHTWKDHPTARYYDVIAIGIDATVSGIPDTKYFKQSWTEHNECDKVSYRRTSTSGTWTISSSGYGVKFKLPVEKSQCGSYTPPFGTPIFQFKKNQFLTSYMYFEINKLTSPINTINAYGDYAHAIKSIDLNFVWGFTIGSGGAGVGITIEASNSTKFDHIDVAQAYWNELNW